MDQSFISRRQAVIGAALAGAGFVTASAFAKKGKPADPPATPPPATPPATPPASAGAKKAPDKAKADPPAEVEGRADHPSDAEAHSTTLGVVLMEEHHHHVVHQGKNIHLVPASLGHVTDAKQIARGITIGTLDTEIAGDETGLPPGKYHIVAAKVGKDWHTYAVQNGKIRATGKRSTWTAIQETSGTKGHKHSATEFHEKGWGWTWNWPWTSWFPAIIPRAVSQGGGNIVSQGGGNVVSQGGGNFGGYRSNW